uniref:Protein NolC n=1 Tax=Rhizobium fredii TaxID=380 RepID=NOLC_RHIFR|nr:RecName: Full=Protein NolC [Sinorhizobium fredii]AAA26333.1 nodulation protein [Sinorhizobium fredii]
MKRDLYETLGVARNADEKELKSAFRKLAMQYHPDRNPGDQEAEKSFKEINQAYETLKDPQKRAAYDRYGHAAFEQGGMGAGFGNGFAGGSAGGTSRHFRRHLRRDDGRRSSAPLLGRSRTRCGPSLQHGDHPRGGLFRQDGADPRADVGHLRRLHGLGREAGHQPEDLRHLPGLRPYPRRPGLLLDRTHLPDLRRSRSDDHRSLQQMPWPGPGHRGAHAVGQYSDRHRGRHAYPPLRRGRTGLRGGPPGDLYIFLSVRPHEFYQRDGADLYCSVPISMTTATLGGKFDVTTLDGTKSRVTVPEGTQAGKQFRLKGKGMHGRALQPDGRPLYPDPDRDAAEAHQAPARIAAGVRADLVQGEQSAIDGLLLPHERFLRYTERIATPGFRLCPSP